MTTEQTSQQLELAAQLIRTGHPWEWLSVDNKWIKAYHNKPEVEIATGHRIRPILATPPDNRPLHNPDNLTAEQVGVGYRLLTEDEFQEDVHLQHQEWWSISVRPKSWMVGDLGRSRSPKLNFATTYRLPLSIPWSEPGDPYAKLKAAHAAGKVIECRLKDGSNQWSAKTANFNEFPSNCEYRIKPESTFQLPPPPPGMQWHRTDMWQEGDLPQGMRPLVAGEESGNGTQQKYDTGWVKLHNSVIADAEENPMRTSRPLTFTHAGKAWTWHRPGDPMPCDGGRRVECVFADHVFWINNDLLGKDVRWTNDNDIGDIIGWRYADEKKTNDETIADLSDNEILQLRQLLNLFSPILQAQSNKMGKP